MLRRTNHGFSLNGSPSRTGAKGRLHCVRGWLDMHFAIVFRTTQASHGNVVIRYVELPGWPEALFFARSFGPMALPGLDRIEITRMGDGAGQRWILEGDSWCQLEDLAA